MAKQTKKTTAGSGGLVSGKKMNMKVAILVIIAVAIAGGLSVFLSHAGTGYSFVRTASQMRGGYQNKLYANGTRSATSPVDALVSKKEMTNTKKICVHYTVQTVGPTGGFGFEVSIVGPREVLKSQIFSISGKAKGFTDYACLPNLVNGTVAQGHDPVTGLTVYNQVRYTGDGIIRIQMAGRGGILVDKVEGRPQ